MEKNMSDKILNEKMYNLFRLPMIVTDGNKL